MVAEKETSSCLWKTRAGESLRPREIVSISNLGDGTLAQVIECMHI
jgi:hypothetical protein